MPSTTITTMPTQVNCSTENLFNLGISKSKLTRQISKQLLILPHIKSAGHVLKSAITTLTKDEYAYKICSHSPDWSIYIKYIMSSEIFQKRLKEPNPNAEVKKQKSDYLRSSHEVTNSTLYYLYKISKISYQKR